MSKIFTEKKVNHNNTSYPKLTFYPQHDNEDKNFIIKRYTIFSAATKEWRNSIYFYDKNSLKTLSISDITVSKLIKIYFNLIKYPVKKDKNIKDKPLKSFANKKKLSSKKIFVSKADFKHTNSKVIITVYIYNAIEKYLANRVKKLNKILVFRKKQYKKIILKAKKQEKNLMIKIKKQVKIITKEIPLWNEQSKTYKKDFIEKFLMTPQTNLVYKKLKIQFLILKYLNKIYFHRSKFSYLQLAPLRYLISKIYNKEILFNIINLKYLFLNSDVLSQPVALKMMKRKIKLLKAFKLSISLARLPRLRRMNTKKYKNKRVWKNYFIETLNNFFISGLNKKNKDIVQETLIKRFNIHKGTERSIIKSIDYRVATGVRIQGSGRLSRRYTASRSLSKFKYKGTLKNLSCSKFRVASVLLRGHVKPNLQYTTKISKTRNGSFGLKGWVSST